MRVRTFLRELRGDRLLVDVERSLRAAGVKLSRADLSRFERGQQIPTDQQATDLEQIYGPRSEWFPATVAHALAPDLDDCPGCGEPLDPSASRRRRYHGDECRALARRAA
jgi:hypothetical protein